MIERHIPTTTHGRYLIEPAEGRGPAPVIVGFHGYGETADVQLDRLRAVRGAQKWMIVSIQALHLFYKRRTEGVVASWLTRQDRELGIADNLAYVRSALDSVFVTWPARPPIVFAGFSQGVAMAFRAAVNTLSQQPVAVLAIGGDIPGDLDDISLRRVSRVMICRGALDQWYTTERYLGDVERLKRLGISCRHVEFNGGHEWSSAMSEPALRFMTECDCGQLAAPITPRC